MDPSEIADLDIENLAARLSENPQSPLFARLADLYLSRQRVDEAVALCEKGISLYPTYAGGHIVLGKCYEALGAFSKARASYRHALDLSPYNSVVHRLLVSLPEIAHETAELGDLSGIVSDVVVTEEPSTLPDVIARVTPVTEIIPPARVVPDTPAPSAAPAITAAPAVPTVTDTKNIDASVAARESGELPPLRIAVSVPVGQPALANDTPRIPSDQTESGMSKPLPFPADETAATKNDDVDWLSIDDDVPPTDTPTPEVVAPSFDPFPTFEQYIDLHPTTEPTMTLEEYLKGRSSSPMSEPSTDFESLAKKLQNAKRIVPSETAPTPMMTPDESPASGQMIVSPTMAEIYVSQKEYEAAISVYQLLSHRQPEQAAAFGARIAELQAALSREQQ